MSKLFSLFALCCLTALAFLSLCDARPSFTPKSIVPPSHNRHIAEHGSIKFPSTLGKSLSIPRGGASPIAMAAEASSELTSYFQGTRADTIILLLMTALNAPICQKFKVSPILGFLSLGLLFGPNGKGLIADVHTTELFADLGIVLFLFEMGIHLDVKTLLAMKKDVFGIGLTQFSVTAIVIAGICKLLGYSVPAMIIIGWSLALSSSAFVLQLLKDKDQMGTQYGKSSFGSLLLQDLMVVPLLVITPILAGKEVVFRTARSAGN